ncbi:uncharacterized protein LOC135843463 [Planococcus citri]|uniref:uncharacterized protein LOC135843463 n=1 Tax=Planococcus citri TaxID=170843 RepID=UPI0031F9E042
MRTNGALLGKCTSKRVSMIGTVQVVLPNNMAFNILSGDSFNITVNLKEPLTENVTGLVEVHGIAKGPSTIECDYYILFPVELAKTYDATVDNEAVNLGYHIANAWH